MSTREALLIGVPECAYLPDFALPVVHRDVGELQTALESCDYRVRTLGVENPADATRNTIRRAIREACSGSTAGGTLLLYFTGHGIHYKGKDLLLPYDADLGTDLTDTLVSTDIAEMVINAPASTIIFFIDACREGVHWKEKAAGITGWSSAEQNIASDRGFITVFSCSPGEVSQYVSGEFGFSLFTRALSTVFSTGHAAKRMDEILQAAQQELDRIVVAQRKRPQRITWKGEQSIGSDWQRRIISDYRTVVHNTAGTDWVEAVRNSRLWLPVGTVYSEYSWSRYYDASVLVARLAQIGVRNALATLPGDPWRDMGFPVRVLEQIEQLLIHAEISLTPAEAALLVLAPFVHEAIYAEAIRELSIHDPLTVSAVSEDDTSLAAPKAVAEHAPLNKKLRIFHTTRPRLVRAAVRLARGKPTDRRQSQIIAAWMMHDFIGREPSFWRSLPSYLSGALEKLDSDETFALHSVGRALSHIRLFEFSRCTGCDPARIERSDTSRPLQLVTVVAFGEHRVEIREQLMAYLLSVAGWMAFDCRIMPEIVATHVSGDVEYTPDNLIQALQHIRWQPLGSSRMLMVQCEHPVTDYAIRDHLRRASEALEFVRTRSLAVSQLECLSALPTRLGDGGIRPAQAPDGRRAYELPHISFTVDPDEIREMLMGKQLYADPDLAIRELYQNALDACRYSNARIEYLKRRNECPPGFRDWKGKITFRYGRANDGRRYIECVDTGVGMGKRELERCFAKAGRRFRDLPEFLEEQEQWFGCEPPVQMYPNSRFGVGVFSYFMLADDIEVETCRLDRQGRIGHRLVVQMSAGGGLFRIKDEGAGSCPGTTIRLYLKTKRKAGFIAETLSKHLRIGEYATEVIDGRHRRRWEAGIPGNGKQRFPYAYPSDSPNLWWVRTGDGEILADGIVVELDRSQVTSLLSYRRWLRRKSQPDSLEWLTSTGVLVNLTGDNFPVLTVDRRTALKVDSKWIRDLVVANMHTLYGSRFCSIDQLWLMQHYFPDHISVLTSRFTDHPVSVRVDVREAALEVAQRDLRPLYVHPHKLTQASRRVSKVRPDRLGIHKHDLIFFLIPTYLQDDHNPIYEMREIEDALRALGWIKRESIEGFVYENRNPILTFYDLLSRAGTLDRFASRLRAWVGEGLDPHPFLASILTPVDRVTYRSYRRAVRRYHQRQLLSRIAGWFWPWRSARRVEW